MTAITEAPLPGWVPWAIFAAITSWLLFQVAADEYNNRKRNR
jgi:hypothetical protein